MKKLLCLFSGLLLFTLDVPASLAADPLSASKGDLRVMTYNANEGTDFIEVQQAATPLQFLLAVGQTITQVRATNPPQRMKALAKQIISAGPELVSVQEVDKWSSGAFDPVAMTCGPTRLEFDMLHELQEALTAQGAHYRVAVRAQQYAFPPTPGLIPPSTFFCVQVVNEVAILARTDLERSVFHWNNPRSAQFVNKLFFPTPTGALLPFPRAWVSVDAVFQGKAFRFINTHLESVDPNIRELQGDELRGGPANTSLPIIVAMDSNAQAFPLPQDATYLDFVGAGYNDVWTEIFPQKPGLTCCQAQLDNNPVSELYQRIDLILTMGPIKAEKIALFGAEPVSRTVDGLWPSDHAGVAGQLTVEE